MFGVNKCFGGSAYGVILTFDDYKTANETCDKLRAGGGDYKVINMNEIKTPSDEEYINEVIQRWL